ncbi:bifunctional enzyme IspD/IspF [Azorhizobium oxalatiphilum]|uniref:Bifunctional enzyme IspD/IspF n=1 Tax=Azorhizobium oxalatiphilum TaxID=980631 RepID=A0A917FJD1_9HYPH|nr:bifunctional 2-C-methyl-D-erythritol 4-phosphate cytidylyltransferase/2-C-methyl-D-erythritol 2,4-cyclodiphosphate synthase [Azorhizobium oxalatiphilum]GGF83291.1 bifunctional enzyme IspD/IspF [Azorhizobium oxalatiphilum]
MACAVLIVAAGRGTRAGGALPKQYHTLAGETVLRRTLRAFSPHPAIDAIQVVIHPDDADHYAASTDGLAQMRPPVPGGATRQQSVLAGLEALAAFNPHGVLVHDGARPFTSAAVIARAVAALETHAAAIPVLAVTDTIKQVDAAGGVTGTPDRATLRVVQTPQAFRFADLIAAHRAAAAAGRTDFTDDAAVMEWAGHRVSTFEGDAGNVKLTSAEDLARAARALADLPDVRTGTGFDVHAFGPGDHVMLGGLAIPFEKGLDGHSDADVGLHALTDAVLGALADGDIGAHFPPSDPQWKGATSDRFLAFALERVKARGGIVTHLDLTLICEAPKVGPHRDAIRAAIAGITGLPVGRISVKATTTEKLGFAGRREGIAAMASATIRLPLEDAL